MSCVSARELPTFKVQSAGLRVCCGGKSFDAILTLWGVEREGCLIIVVSYRN